VQDKDFQIANTTWGALANLDNIDSEYLQRAGSELIPGKDTSLDEDFLILILTQIVSDFSLRIKKSGAVFQLLVNKELLFSEVILHTDDDRHKDRIELSPREVWSLGFDCECSVLIAAANVTAVLVADYVVEDLRRRSMPLWSEEMEPEVEECVRSAVIRSAHTELFPVW
jgi:hypothetical protein